MKRMRIAKTETSGSVHPGVDEKFGHKSKKCVYKKIFIPQRFIRVSLIHIIRVIDIQSI